MDGLRDLMDGLRDLMDGLRDLMDGLRDLMGAAGTASAWSVCHWDRWVLSMCHSVTGIGGPCPCAILSLG